MFKNKKKKKILIKIAKRKVKKNLWFFFLLHKFQRIYHKACRVFFYLKKGICNKIFVLEV
jgi:hypothetical protein